MEASIDHFKEHDYKHQITYPVAFWQDGINPGTSSRTPKHKSA